MKTSKSTVISILSLALAIPCASGSRFPWCNAQAGSAKGTALQTPKQPKVAPGPSEPDWEVILRDRYGLSMYADLKNPVKTSPEATPGLFRKAGNGPVQFRPVIALGLPTRNLGGWYKPVSTEKGEPAKVKLWSYTYKNTTEDLRTEQHLPPPLDSGSSTEFDPGEKPFGLWVSNDGLADGGVFSEPGAGRPALSRDWPNSLTRP